MPTGFQILDIQQQDQAVIAVLPMSRVLGRKVGSLVDADLDLLAKLQANVVILDLRQVEFIDGLFFSRILQFKKALDASSGHLSLCVGGKLRETIEILQFDRLFKIIDHVSDGDSQVPSRPWHPSP